MGTSLLNLIGLVFDIVGVLLLWRYGLPPSIDRGGRDFYVSHRVDEKEKKKAESYDRISRVAIILVLAGFMFQAASASLSLYVSLQKA